MDSTAALQLASAIQTHEGYFPGSLSYRQNNPGNLMYVGQSGASAGTNGLAVFPSYQAGLSALVDQINLDSSRGLTLSQFISKYAPPGENNTSAYLSFVSQYTGFSPSDPLSSIGSADTAGSDSGDYAISTIALDPTTWSTGTLVAIGTAGAAMLFALMNAFD
jgi:hypothetical protein